MVLLRSAEVDRAELSVHPQRADQGEHGGSRLRREQPGGVHALQRLYHLLLGGRGQHHRALPGVQALVRGQRLHPAVPAQLKSPLDGKPGSLSDPRLQ